MLGAAIPEQRHESGWVEGVAIWVAIAVVVLVGAWGVGAAGLYGVVMAAAWVWGGAGVRGLVLVGARVCV